MSRIKDRFFVIDSNNLNEVETSFYGYMVSTDGIFDKDNWQNLSVDMLSGLGAYLYIDRNEDTIDIYQDFSGSWGLYLYRREDYFAISNSIIKLIEFLSEKCDLSLNRDYALKLLSEAYACFCVDSTIVNEISLLRRNTTVHINVNLKQLSVSNNPEPESVSVDSREGIELLDKWYEKWCRIIRKLNKHTSFMSTDLSGGYDSRMSLVLVLGSQIDLNHIRFNSFTGNLYTRAEDYVIAGKIAERFGFILNGPTDDNKTHNMSMDEIISNAFYSKLLIHKEFFWQNKKYLKKKYEISGAGGEALRLFRWGNTRESYTSSECNQANKFNKTVAAEMKQAILREVDKAYELMKAKSPESLVANIDDPNPIYRETVNRMHFGKICEEFSYCNIYKLEPLVDPDVYRLRKTTPECGDRDLLMAVIFERYCPELLEFEIQGGRSILDTTREYAKEINKRYPYIPKEYNYDEGFDVVTIDQGVRECFGGKNVAPGDVDYLINEMVHSERTRRVFEKYFDAGIYEYALSVTENREYVPLKEGFAVLGIAKTIYEIEHKGKKTETSLLQSLSDMSGISEDGLQDRIWSFPFDKVGYNKRIILYGAGNLGKSYKQQIDDNENSGIQIIKWVDKDYKNKKDFGVESVDSILNDEYDMIVMAIVDMSVRNNALNMLCDLGIERTSIVV